MSFSCTDKDTLIAYVYGECDDATQGAVEAHLSTCPACADEAGGFGRVRAALSEWAPPERVGSFRLVREDEGGLQAPARVLRPARWWQAPLPALAKVAAGVLLFAGGAALANLEVRYDNAGVSVRTGWQRAEAVAVRAAASQPAAAANPSTHEPPAAPAAVQTEGQAGSPWRPELAALERQLRDEFRQELATARTTAAGAAPLTVSAGADAADRRFLATVQAMIDDSYQRQRIETADRISQVAGEFQAQRRADPARVQPADATAPAVPRQRQMMNNLFPVTLKK
jgi:anti-sigma factor ChrR (cupin superfamily)